MRQSLDFWQPAGKETLQSRPNCRFDQQVRAEVIGPACDQRRRGPQDFLRARSLKVSRAAAAARKKESSAALSFASARSSARREKGGQPASRRSSSALEAKLS